MKLKSKIISLAVCLSFCLVALFNAVYYRDENVKTHETVMDVTTIDYMSLLEEFDEKELIIEEEHVKLEASQYLDKDFFSELDNLSYNDNVATNSYIDYSFDFNHETNLIIVTISFYEDDVLVSNETMEGVPFVNEEGKTDALFVDGEEVVYLSDFTSLDEFENCGLFSKLKKAVKKVANVVKTVAAQTAVYAAGIAVACGVVAVTAAAAVTSGGVTLPVGIPAALTTITVVMTQTTIIAAGISAGSAVIEAGVTAMPDEITIGNSNNEGIKEVYKDDKSLNNIREIIKTNSSIKINDVIVNEIKVEGTKLIVKGETKLGVIKEVTVNNGSLVPDKGFDTFDHLKKYLGDPGTGNAWHHIVEQSQIDKAGFSPEDVNNVNNIISIPHGAGSVHAAISGYYNSKPAFTNDLSVRDWLAQNKTFEEQFEFGLDVLRKYGEVVATEEGWKFFPFEK